MGYRLTHFKFFVRKILRNETRRGNLLRLLVAFFLTLVLLMIRNNIPNDIDTSLQLELFFKIRGKISPPEQVVLIAIDDISYSKLNISHKKAFPRDIAAKALNEIQDEKPKFVILDLDVPEQSDEHEATLELAKAISKGPTSIALSPVIDDAGREVYNYSAKEIREVVKYEIPMVFNSYPGIIQYLRLSGNNAPTPYPLLEALREEVSPSIKTPTDMSMINYYGPPGTIRTFSLWEFFSEDRIIPKYFFKDKVVVIGFKSDLRERGNTPKEVLSVPVNDKYGRNLMYGAEIHATTAGNFINQEWIKRLSIEKELLLLTILFFIFLSGVILFEPFWGFIYIIFYLTTWLITTYLLFSKFNFFIPGVLFGTFSIFIIAYGSVLTEALLVKKELKKLKQSLGIN